MIAINKHYTFQEYIEKFSSIQDSYDYYFELQKAIDNADIKNLELIEELNNREEEIERLNNIINELEEELDKEYDTYITKNVIYGKTFKAGANVFREHIKYKLQELKGSDK